MLCGHGSRNRLAVEEFATPILREGLERLRRQGVRRVLAAPGMHFAVGHAKNDIPSVLNTYAAESGLRIDDGRELGVDPKMMRAAGARLRECLDRAPEVPLADTRAEPGPRPAVIVGITPSGT